MNNYPYSNRKTKTYMISGSHDLSFFKQNGYDIIRRTCERRQDLVYRGAEEATFKVKGVVIKLLHPGGGLSYAVSYRPQKIIESMMGFIMSTLSSKGEVDIPKVVVFGHWHVPMHLPSYMGVDGIALPCLQSITPFLTRIGKFPSVGCAVAELSFDKDNNLTSTKVEFINMNTQIKEADY